MDVRTQQIISWVVSTWEYAKIPAAIPSTNHDAWQDS